MPALFEHSPLPSDRIVAARAYLAAGRDDLAVRLAQELLAEEPGCSDALHLLGSAAYANGNLAEGVKLLRLAVSISPDRADFQNDLGTVEGALGSVTRAASCYREAVKLQPNFIPAYDNLASVLVEMGHFDEAVEQYRTVLALSPGYTRAWGSFANILRDVGNWADAEIAYRTAINQEPNMAWLWNNMAVLYLMAGENEAAFKAARQALAFDDSTCNRALITRVLQAGLPSGEDVSALLLRALQEGWCRPGDLSQTVILALRAQHGANTELLFFDPLFHVLLKFAPVCDAEIERSLGVARHKMLEATNRTWTEQQLAFHVALAHQCFLTEYLLPVSVAEQAVVDTLGSDVQQLVSYAAYRPLHTLGGAEALLGRTWPASISGLLQQQVAGPLREENLRKLVRSVTPIGDEVSVRVRGQYEANPYPRWTAAAPPDEVMSISRYLRSRFPKASCRFLPVRDVLVAGCGTGRTAIELALLLGKDVNVLALDLSLSSLAYGWCKAEDVGIENITFVQGDFLLLDGTFDCISAGGVLHHLADPISGWRHLVTLLRPGGFMQLGLYSAQARNCLTAARASVRRPCGQAALREARQAILAQGAIAEPLMRFPDFYSLSEFRDLLFHEHENVLSLKQIMDFLEKESLDFVGMDVDDAVLRRFERHFPGKARDLSAWIEFEEAYPNTFVNMYQFWIQKGL